MKSYYTDITNKELPGILLLSHGTLACSLLDTAKLIAGEQIENIAALCLEAGDYPNEFKLELQKILHRMPENTLVLVDLFGGTPSNQFIASLGETKHLLNAISGMNLPMLLEIIAMRNQHTNEELAKIADETGKVSICNVTERIFGQK